MTKGLGKLAPGEKINKTGIIFHEERGKNIIIVFQQVERLS